jgi:hypothetical protein
LIFYFQDNFLYQHFFFPGDQNKIKCQGDFYKGNISSKNGPNIHQFRLFKKLQRTARFHEGTSGFPGGYFDFKKKERKT